MGEVLMLPMAQRKPDCRICVNAIAGEQVYCRVFSEWIFNEVVARDCEHYEEDVGKA